MENNIYVILNVYKKGNVKNINLNDMIFMVKDYQVAGNDFKEVAFKKIDATNENISNVYLRLENIYSKSYGVVNEKQYVFLPIIDIEMFNKLAGAEGISTFVINDAYSDPDMLYKALKGEINSEIVYPEDIKAMK